MSNIKALLIDELLADWPEYGKQFYVAIAGQGGYYMPVDGNELKAKLSYMRGNNHATHAVIHDDGYSLILSSTSNIV